MTRYNLAKSVYITALFVLNVLINYSLAQLGKRFNRIENLSRLELREKLSLSLSLSLSLVARCESTRARYSAIDSMTGPIGT